MPVQIIDKPTTANNFSSVQPPAPQTIAMAPQSSHQNGGGSGGGSGSHHRHTG